MNPHKEQSKKAKVKHIIDVQEASEEEYKAGLASRANIIK